MKTGFAANFVFERSPSATGPESVPRFGGMPVAAFHANTYCKPLLCLPQVCANLFAHRSNVSLRALAPLLRGCCAPPASGGGAGAPRLPRAGRARRVALRST